MNNAGFQISLDLYGRLCVVIGGEDEAAHKTALLLDVGAKVTVVNPTLNGPLRKLTAAGKVLHRGRRFDRWIPMELLSSSIRCRMIRILQNRYVPYRKMNGFWCGRLISRSCRIS